MRIFVPVPSKVFEAEIVIQDSQAQDGNGGDSKNRSDEALQFLPSLVLFARRDAFRHSTLFLRGNPFSRSTRLSILNVRLLLQDQPAPWISLWSTIYE
jgi:hypothetical protein